ncbi:hypothetical protein L2750_14595 [Shewanella submarina]|uniref:Uncharacterized protein n=1 Tax=Shewanella submarina TaxID=2016376 RepID=A0ABV7G8T6_9GAMM|nr:hypothetical protein [Shewanella submarina]MCL1038360.1 hypothetical protein [Shewanella submarina]
MKASEAREKSQFSNLLEEMITLINEGIAEATDSGLFGMLAPVQLQCKGEDKEVCEAIKAHFRELDYVISITPVGSLSIITIDW